MDDHEPQQEVFKKPLKRKRSSQGSIHSGEAGLHASDSQDGGKNSGVTAFRTVSACNRCRSRKNRCDQALPACGNCEKAGTPCVGYDANLNRSVPRNYVLYLENRVGKLEAILQEHGIPYPPATELAIDTKPNGSVAKGNGSKPQAQQGTPMTGTGLGIDVRRNSLAGQDDLNKKERSFTGPDRRVSMSAISFASVVREAVKKYIAHGARAALRGTRDGREDGPQHDSFFGLYSPPITRPARFPEPDLARDLAHLYFEHANPQIPILHRGEFAKFLERVYNTPAEERTARTVFFVNITCAIGAGIIMDKSGELDQQASDDEIKTEQGTSSLIKRAEPEQYFAAAMTCLETFMSAPKAMESTPPGLEELQAVLLVANFSLLRPVTPGLWYIAGIAMRLAKNLGLYHEGVEDIDSSRPISVDQSEADAKKHHQHVGRLWWSRDMRRRLWYCAYSIDRLVSVCVGRPTSIDETVITTPFPSGLDDRYIGPTGIDYPPVSPGAVLPSYKRVSYHYFRLRLLQSEVLQVLESRRAQLIRATGLSHLDNHYIPTDLKEPYLARFNGDFRNWRLDIDARLSQWQREGPRREDTGVKFDPLFLDLNYWQTMVMLYRHSLSIPEQLAGELDESTLEESRNTTYADAEDREDEQMVFYKAGVAGQQVLRIYRQLHLKRLVNYTYLATHHIFICGVTFLYSIWQSPLVRQSIKREDIDLTVLAATTVLTALIPKCPPAQNARDAFKRMSKVTMAFYLANLPSDVPSQFSDYPLRSPIQNRHAHLQQQPSHSSHNPNPRRPSPQFDTGFKSLFSEEDLALNSPDFPLPRKFLPVFDRSNPRPTSNPTSHGPVGAGGMEILLDPSLRDTNSNNNNPSGGSGAGQTPFSHSHPGNRTPNSAHPSDASVGGDGSYFDDSFWEYFQGDTTGGQMAGTEGLGAAGMGFELGFGAGGLVGGEGTAAGADWPERGFEMLDGWLLGGTSGG
ncbi:fungal-specific transcription factor domain-containing protein [Elsinoe ampelina]|uniref:Fungal-specific transcription factor domain-containing protein n=1 Tax=Elsinoe ampelina TaxID=302913 RepID=A0A6A6GNY1_9PEZI|nr:fungal-specific transcription factor domain-containing protein [Elsinoe ampelina]